jgi:phage RecT family recombinase
MTKMPNDITGQEIAPAQNRGVAAAFQTDLDAYTPNLMQALPVHVSVEKFKRVLITAVSSNPDLLYANRRTLFTAAVKCASDGLLPDGREAALVVYNTKIKQRDPNTGLDRELRIDAVQYLPMVAGIRKRMRNTGEVLSADAHVVHENDKFQFKLGDDGFIDHEPAGLSTEPGKALGAYAIIKLKSGEVLRDVMRASDIEKTRKQSRGANGLMWTTFAEEAWRKTVLRRCSKAAPQSAELESLLNRDEEPPMMPDFEALPPAAVEPEPDRAANEVVERDFGPLYHVIDLDGVEHDFLETANAMAALIKILGEAAKMDLLRLEGAWESNEGSVALWPLSVEAKQELRAGYEQLRASLKPPPTPRRASPARESAKPAPEAAPPPSPPPAPAEAPAQIPFPGDMPAGRFEEAKPVQLYPERAPAAAPAPPPKEPTSLVIPPPIRRGAPDWRTWAVALLIPAVRRCQDTDTLAFLIGDNDANLTLARADLDKADLAAMEEAIAQKFRELGDA